ncbi:penicillin acylase family protein [Zhongshania sp. BJYM1]|uniref:penicillin acylase family protein n=1 Tax=Zhongshania aquatica TaxID=2965069 RepID=UPI0022B2B148|nr:penicillin acylase family protein [Marortus sp. BJYM1]
MPQFKDVPGIIALLLRLTIGHIQTPRQNFSIKQRVDALPLDNAPLIDSIKIHWNDNLIPFIHAENESDLAVGLGISHAHLRLGQIEFLKYVSQGRLSELLGPIANDIDHTLRVLDLGKVSKASYAAMPESTQKWMQSYAAGINYVVENISDNKSLWPEEFQILNVQPTRWAVEDLLTLARLNCADFTWGMWPKLLPLRKRKDWFAVWRHLMKFGGGPPVPKHNDLSSDDALEWLSGLFGKPGGSNAVAIAAEKTAAGNALLSGDPHLPMVLPNFWILGGLYCPTLKAVGYMLPGLPAVMVGRSGDIAWGGSSMHAASSDLFDVSHQASSSFKTRTETIKTRWGGNKTVTLRDSDYGPLLTDAPMFSNPTSPTANSSNTKSNDVKFAFRWVGHQVSDEITAMLGVARSRTFGEFQTALKDFAVAGQNMVYADTSGNIGQLMAARLPKRPSERPSDVVLDVSEHQYWNHMIDTRALPTIHNPDIGFVASSNNKPDVDSDVLISCFFSPDDRVERLKSVLSEATNIDSSLLRALMTDVKSDTGVELRNAILPFIKIKNTHVYECLANWNGEYTTDSAGALVFEFLLYHFALALHGKEDMDVMTVSWDPRSLLMADIQHVPAPVLAEALNEALSKCKVALQKYGTWGAVHRLRMNHPLAALPVLGKRWRYGESAVAGANETLMKSAHGFAKGKHYVGMSSTARYFFDLGDTDSNWFAMLGGQDGLPGSDAFIDQVTLWNAQDMIQIPINIATVEKTFTLCVTVRPSNN